MISKKIISGLAEMTQNTLVIFTFQICLGTLTIHGRNTRTIVIQFKVFRHAILLSSHPYSSKPFYHLIALSTNYSVTHTSYYLGTRLPIHCPQAGFATFRSGVLVQSIKEKAHYPPSTLLF